MGGSTKSSTSSGASSTVGNPGINARMTPVSIRRIALGILSRVSATATDAMTISSNISV